MQHLIVPPGAGSPIQLGGFGTIPKIPGSATEGSVSVVEHTLDPGLLGAPRHRHRNEFETSYVMEGELTVQIGDEVATVPAGGWVVKPRGVFHTFWNAGDRPVRFLEIISPAGFEEYFVELAELIPESLEPDLEKLAALAARYGLEFDFESLPALMREHGVRLG